eukprot:9877010-Alexandrium_andersonii.AAC.1
MQGGDTCLGPSPQPRTSRRPTEGAQRAGHETASPTTILSRGHRCLTYLRGTTGLPQRMRCPFELSRPCPVAKDAIINRRSPRRKERPRHQT